MSIIITREVNRFLNTKETPFSVEGLKEVKQRVMKIIKRCNNKLKKKNKLSERDFSKTQDSAQKPKFIDTIENPYDHGFGLANRTNLTSTMDMEDSRNKNNQSMIVGSIKRSGLTQLPKVTSRDDMKRSIYKNTNMSPASLYSTPAIINRDKYRRSLSQGRSGEFNKNLNRIIDENKRKESEIQMNDRLAQKLAQTKHKKDLAEQIKYAQDIKHQLKTSNLQMDEEYINM